jgi:hypothetical protein
MKQHETWLEKALRDLKSAKKLFESDEPILDTAIYHTQQCAEKALKAYLVSSTDKIRYLNIAQASLEECRYYLILSKDLRYSDVSTPLVMLTIKISNFHSIS